MPELILRRAMPTEWEALPRDFRPMFVTETDIQRIVADEEGVLHQRKRRTRTLTYLDADQNLAVLPFDLGPATGTQEWVMPCGGAEDIAHIWDLMEWVEEERVKREEREAEVAPIRTREWLRALQDNQEQNDLALVGASTFGPQFRKQREAPNK